MSEEQPCRKESGHAGRQQAQCESAESSGSPKGKPCPGVHQTEHHQSLKIIPLYSVLVWPHLEHWVPAFEKDVKVLECIQKRTKLVEGLEGMSCEEQLRTLGLPSLEKSRMRGKLITLHSFLRRGSEEGGAELFSLVCTDRMHGNSSKLPQERFKQDIRKHFFTGRVVKSWNRLLKELIDAPSLSLFKRHLDNALNNMLYLLVGPEVFR